jgi:hypothetical protein
MNWQCGARLGYPQQKLRTLVKRSADRVQHTEKQRKVWKRERNGVAQQSHIYDPAKEFLEKQCNSVFENLLKIHVSYFRSSTMMNKILLIVLALVVADASAEKFAARDDHGRGLKKRKSKKKKSKKKKSKTKSPAPSSSPSVVLSSSPSVVPSSTPSFLPSAVPSSTPSASSMPSAVPSAVTSTVAPTSSWDFYFNQLKLITIFN